MLYRSCCCENQLLYTSHTVKVVVCCLQDARQVPAPETNIMRLEALEQRLNMLVKVVCTWYLLLKSGLYNWNFLYEIYVDVNPCMSPKYTTTAFYPCWPWVSWYQKNIHSLTPCVCGYYTFIINFCHFLRSVASSLHICWVWQSFSATSPKFPLACL